VSNRSRAKNCARSATPAFARRFLAGLDQAGVELGAEAARAALFRGVMTMRPSPEAEVDQKIVHADLGQGRASCPTTSCGVRT